MIMDFIQHFQNLGWTPAQGKALAIVPKVMGALSFGGSAYIIYDCCTDTTKLRNSARRGNQHYHRIMFGMSILDCCSSFFGPFLGTWVMPKGYHYYAAGTLATCDAASFFHQLGSVGTPLYNCSLVTFLLLVIKYNWAPSRIYRVQKWFHIVPWTICVTMAIAGFPLKVFGPTFFSCWTTSSYPIECDITGETCIRSAGTYHLYYWIAIAVIAFLSICYVAVGSFKLYRFVLKTERDAEKYDFLARFRETQTQSNRHRSRQLMKQGFLYSLALLFVWALPIFVVITMYIFGPKYIPFLLLSIMYPMQGILNFVIYLMPKHAKPFKSTRASMIEMPLTESMKQTRTNYGVNDVRTIEEDAELNKWRRLYLDKLECFDGDKSSDNNLDCGFDDSLKSGGDNLAMGNYEER